MEKHIKTYIMRCGEPYTSVTARICWSSDGKIEPRFFWTPDGTKHKIVSHGPGIFLSLLKERGEGLRYKVRSEIVDAPELHTELLHTQYDTELYLADNRFCQKNIIDERYNHASKEYIKITMDVFPDAEYELVCFWCRNERYMVERTIAVEPRASYKAGGTGLRHKVTARLVNAHDDEDPEPSRSECRPASLFLEFNKWFVWVA
jgi:hypothetical protein